jgi:transcriptional regulator with XRE-family HTH domain
VRTPALRYWRVQRAMLQEQLAERANVHTASIQRGEHGQPLRLTTVRRLADALEVKPADLMSQPRSCARPANCGSGKPDPSAETYLNRHQNAGLALATPTNVSQ